MKNIKKSILIFAISGLIFSFVNAENMTVVTAKTEDASVSSVKDAVSKLINSKNYTIEVSTNAGPIEINYEMYYTENGFYDNYLADEYGYVATNEGVFSFDLYNREFTASKLLEDEEGNRLTSIWGNDLFIGFDKLRVNEFEKATGKTFKADTKRVKTMMMNLFHVDLGYYQYALPVEFKVGDTVDSLEFSLILSNNIRYDAKVTNWNKTTIAEIDDYLAEGNKHHTSSEGLNKIISLFDNFNYTRFIYDDPVTDPNDETIYYYDTIAGKEIYNENYFYTFFEEQYILEGMGYEIGVVSIDKTYGPKDANGITYGPYEFKGSYYCFITENSETKEEELSIITSFPINQDPFVPNVYNYPTFLEMFKNPQYLQETGGNANQYYTSKLSCVEDFVLNFQLTETISSVGAVPTGVYVQYFENGSELYAGTQGKETVVFSLELNYYGAYTTMDFAYTDFNNTYIELFSQDNIDAYINGIIDKQIAKDAENAENAEGAK